MANIRAGIGKLARRGGRRGLLAGAAALIGFGAARLGGDARLAEATHRGTTFDIAWGTNDLPAGAPPQVGVYTSASAPTMIATNLSGPGLFGKGGPDGQYGVWGECEGANGAGVVGKVAGTALSVGVHGQASNGAAVRGDVTGPATNVGSGVVGVAAGCEFTNPSNVGVGGSGRGMSSLANKTGVLGITDGGIGVQGWGMRAGTGVRGLSNFGGGPDVSGSGIGVDGRSGSGIGVFGRSQSGYGAYGRSVDGIGTTGESDANTGVYGLSQGRTGVRGRGGQFGVLAETATGNGVALRAQVSSGVGAFGSCDDAGSGVYGEAATTGNGVLGVSNQGSGVIGRGGQYGILAETLVGSSVALRARTGAGIGAYCSSTDQNGAGVYGENTSGGGIGVRAFSQGVGLYAQGGSRAAVFVGDVEIRGNLIRSGGAVGDAAVRDGGAQSASGRIGDDGRGRIVNGRGSVTLEPAFVAAADTSDYDVTVTPYGESRHLFVAARTPAGFEVREAQGGTSSLEFGYRVSARARSGVPDRRTDGPTAGRGTDGPTGTRGADGPTIVAPEIPPAWRDAGPRPADIPSEWRDVPPPPVLPREGDERPAANGPPTARG